MGSRFSRTPAKTLRAQELRRDATDAERFLWAHLKRGQMQGAAFRRQHPAGRYVLDFYCPELKLAIELDGDQHGWERNARRDRARDAWLMRHGVTVLRFPNTDLLRNRDGVLDTIYENIAALKRQVTPTPPLLLLGGGSPDATP